MKMYLRLRKCDRYFAAIELKKHFKELKTIDAETIGNKLHKSNLEFYYKENVKTPFLIRLTLPFALVVLIIMVLILPINYILTGRWGYTYEPLANWFRSLGF